MENSFRGGTIVARIAIFAAMAAIMWLVFLADGAAAREEVIISGQGTARFESRNKPTPAVLEKVDGKVFILRPGAALWEPALDGASLGRGAEVRTGAQSSCLVRYEDGNLLKLGPSSDLAVDENPAGDGTSEGVAALAKGKIWASVGDGSSSGRMIIIAGDGVFDTRRGNLFVEIGENSRICVDQFSGTSNARMVSSPAETLHLDTNYRAEISPGSPIPEPVLIDGKFNQDDFSYTCISDRDEQKQKSGTLNPVEFSVGDPETVEQQVVISGDASLSVTTGELKEETGGYIDTGGTLVFSPEDLKSDATTGPVVIEYEELVISSSAIITFIMDEKPVEIEPPQACTATPVVSPVSINNRTISPGETVDLISTSCSQESAVITGEASSACGDISAVSVSLNGRSIPVSGKSQWTTEAPLSQPGSYPIRIISSDTSGGTSAPFEFQIAYSRNIPSPGVEIETVAGIPVSDITGVQDLYRDDLTGGRIVITGSASSPSCDLAKVEISLDNGSTWKAVGNTDSLRYEFSPVEGSYAILARASDILGNSSPQMLRPIEIAYHSRKPEENLREIFEAMIRAYKDKNSSTFMNYVSQLYTSNYDSIENTNNLRNSLDGKFADFTTVNLRHRITDILISGDEGRVIFEWTADPAGTGYSYAGVFIFVREIDWCFITVQDDNTFLRYTSIAASITLVAGKNIFVANKTDNTTITAQVRDSAGNPVRDGTEVRFTASMGTVISTATTTRGEAAATYTASVQTPGTAIITATAGGVSSSINLTLKEEHAPLPPE